MVRNKTCRHSLPPPPANVHIATELLPLKVWKRPYCRAMRKTWRCYDLSRSQWRQEVPDCRLYRTNEGFPDNHFWNCRCRKDFVRTVLSTIDALIGTVISDQICIHKYNKSLPTKAELVLFSDDVIRLTSAGFLSGAQWTLRAVGDIWVRHNGSRRVRSRNGASTATSIAPVSFTAPSAVSDCLLPFDPPIPPLRLAWYWRYE